jgi:hypothetical protein
MTKTEVNRQFRYLLNPITLVFLFTLALNDHYLKWKFPGFLTGKLSDFTGVFLFPVFLCASYHLFTGRRFSRNTFYLSALVTAALMVTIKLIPSGNALYLTVLKSFGVTAYAVLDPTDLVSLVMLIPSYYLAEAYRRPL